MNKHLQMSEASVTVMPLADGDDAAEALAVNNSAPAPTMAPPVLATNYARPHLSIVPRDVIVAAVEAIDAKLLPPATMVEYPPAVPGGKLLFKFVTADGGELAAMAVGVEHMTPHVRALWWELAEAIEAESQKH